VESSLQHLPDRLRMPPSAAFRNDPFSVESIGDRAE
jgi:hypothetical protein